MENARLVVVGDVHGEYEKLRSILLHAKVMDLSDTWIAAGAVFVQTGDVIDRGQKSIESVQLIRSLQKQAQEVGGRVVRLFGNHELMLLQGGHGDPTFQKPSELAEQFREEIAGGKLQAAWTDGIRLFSHAGVRTKLRQWLEGETNGTEREYTPKRLSDIVDAANIALIEAAANNKYKGPLFYVDSTRGGRDPYGGLFWGDAGNLVGSEQAFEMPQVFGHTPTGKPSLEVEYGGSLINIDCGMYRGDNCAYLEITSKGKLIEHAKSSRSQQFKSRPLN
jgi:hypothetical protein